MSYPFTTRKVQLEKGGDPSWGIGLVSCDGRHGPSPAAGYSIEITNEGNQSRHDVRDGEFIVEVNGTNLASLGMGEDGHKQYDFFTAPDGPAQGVTLSLVLALRADLEAYEKEGPPDGTMEKSPSPTEQPSSPTKSPTQKPAASAKSPASIKATSPTPSVEATVRDLVPDLADEAVADKPVAEVLKELPANDPKAAEIKKAVYVHTVPYTTRPRRENEVDGREYNFISREEFEAIVKADGMLEWGEKNGTLYGTAKVDSNELGAPKNEDAVSRRSTMKAALAHGPDAVTLAHLLGDEAGELADWEVHQFLAKHKDTHPTHGDKVKQVKTLVYDISIPFTTRPRREGEREGREYHFVSKETFTNMADAGAFMEYGFKNGHAYGTSKLTQDMVKAHKKKLRTTTKDALASSQPEASVAAILGTTGASRVGSDIEASRFLASVDPEHPELADIRNQIKVAIYDITVPLTTREPRKGERNGIDYNFVSPETFQLYIDNDQMLEWGEKKGVFYGTLKVTEKDVKNAKGRTDTRRKTYKETVKPAPPPASPPAAAPYQTVDGAEWHETLV